MQADSRCGDWWVPVRRPCPHPRNRRARSPVVHWIVAARFTSGVTVGRPVTALTPGSVTVRCAYVAPSDPLRRRSHLTVTSSTTGSSMSSGGAQALPLSPPRLARTSPGRTLGILAQPPGGTADLPWSCGHVRSPGRSRAVARDVPVRRRVRATDRPDDRPLTGWTGGPGDRADPDRADPDPGIEDPGTGPTPTGTDEPTHGITNR